jgi:hypothetical protein
MFPSKLAIEDPAALRVILPGSDPFAKALKWRPELSAIGTEVVEEGGTQVEISSKYFTTICQANY